MLVNTLKICYNGVNSKFRLTCTGGITMSVLYKRTVCLLVLLCLTLTAAAGLSLRSYALPDTEVVRVGYYENEVFQEGASENAVKTGYAYEYYRKISEYTGWSYEYVYGDFTEMYEKLLNGEIDLLAGLARREDRVGLIGYPDEPMGNEVYSFVKHSSDTDITAVPNTLSGKRIGALDSAVATAASSYLDAHAISASMITYPSYDALISAFSAGEVDVIAAESDGTSGRDNTEVVCAFGTSDYYICVNRERPDLLDELNAAQAELRVDEPDYINSLRAKYYSVSVSSRAFSDSEKEWLAAHDTLTIGYLNNYLPYSNTSADGNVTGLIRDIVPEMLSVLGISDLKVQYIGFDSYDDMTASMAAQNIDVAFPVGGGLYYSELNGIYQSNAVVSSTTELIYKGKYPEKERLTFAVNENNRMQYYYIMSHFRNADIVFYDSAEENLEAVIAGEADCTTLNGLRANEILRNSRYHELSMKLLTRSDDRCFGVRIGNDGLLKLLNRGINITGAEYIQNIAGKYTDGLYTYTFADMLRDNILLFAGIAVAITAVVIAFLVRDSARSKSQAADREKARIALEEKNRELAQVAQEAKDANRAKTYFLSTMSHDIRTPMNSILSMNEMVLRECDNEDILIYSGHIRASGIMLLGLINDILDFSKIEAGKLDIIPVDYELSSVLNDLVTMLRTKVEEKGLCLALDIDSSMPNYLRGDEIRIKQAVTNILTNAVKYTQKGTVTFSVGYDKTEDDPDSIMLNISVEDTGVGIKEDDIAKLFAAFERIDEANNRNIEGTGLGITITDSLLRLMGSSLKVSSEFGKGSVFSFSLRQKVIDPEPVGDYEAAFRRSIAGIRKYREKFVAPDARVLVVDDTPVNLIVFKNLLKRTKIQIDTADSADECIAYAMRTKYDIIFLDHMMPYKDGIEALKELKSMSGNPNIDTPMICLTANAVSGMKETYLAAGFDDYLTKPINPDSLESTIHGYLPKNKIQSADDTDTEDDTSLIPDFMYNTDGIDVAAGLKHCGSAGAYMDAVRTFLDTAGDNIAEIERFRSENDIRSLTVKIHALKSTSRIIGAEKLGAFAEKLEKAGNANDTSVLENNTDALLSDYRALVTALSPAKPSAVKDKPLISHEKLKEAYGTILEFSEALDYDTIEYMIKSLDGYGIPDDEAERFEKLKRAALNYDYDLIPEIISN